MARKSKKEVDASLTLAQLAERYAQQMERDAKSPGTIASYGMELKLAQAELGAETLVADIKAYDITKFENCARVVKLRSGKAKSELSIAKSRRVLRLAIGWAATAGLIASSPYAPKDESATTTEERPAPAKPKKERRRRGVELTVSQDEASKAADEVEKELAPTPAA